MCVAVLVPAPESFAQISEPQSFSFPDPLVSECAVVGGGEAHMWAGG